MALQFCVVCGRGSSRSTWNISISSLYGNDFPTPYVACDFHSLDEVEASILNLIPQTPAPNVDNQDMSIQESPQT